MQELDLELREIAADLGRLLDGAIRKSLQLGVLNREKDGSLVVSRDQIAEELDD